MAVRDTVLVPAVEPVAVAAPTDDGARAFHVLRYRIRNQLHCDSDSNRIPLALSH